jgi:DNA polymerase IV
MFGCASSPPPPIVAEREALDQESLSQSSPQFPRDALDDAINEIREIGAASAFIEDPEPNSNSESEAEEEMTKTEVPDWQKSFQCMHAHDGTEGQNNPNAKTIEILSKMQAYYERTNDQWRAISYRKAISILKKTEEFISTEEQAKKIPGIGDRLAKKIGEIATTGELQRLQNLDSLDHTIELFMGIYGVGKTRAMRWVMQGLRTLQDILERGDVNESQRIGLELYDVQFLVKGSNNRTLHKGYPEEKSNNILRSSERQR